MSGIVGILNLDGAPIDRDLLERMTRSMAFRGPDARDVWLSGPVGFGHTMLRTTFEAEGEQQPASLDGEVWITADARVDARQDLIRELADRGRTDLETRPDVELILHAYHVWQDACVDHLIGDFAFAIWDSPRRRLFCARDQIGVKPFFYAHVGAQLIISNTLDCLRLHPAVSDRLNEAAIADFLVVNHNQDLATTVFVDIQRLPPAHTLTCLGGDLRIRRYWTLPVHERIRYRQKREYIDHFRDIFGSAVADRLRTSRASIFMSGGVDSPSVAVAIKHHSDPRVRACDLRACSIGFDHLIPDDERTYAAIVARSLGMPIHLRSADHYEIYGHWDDPSYRMPEPSLDPFAAMVRDQYRDAYAHARVVFTGYGADPLFLYQTDVVGLLRAGKPWQIASEIAECLFVHRRLPPVGIRTTLRRLRPSRPKAVPIPSWINPDFAKRMEFAERYRQQTPQPIDVVHPVRGDAQQSILHRRWVTFLEAEDPGVIGLPLETRHPFFDLRVVHYTLAIPPVPWSQNKELLRAAMLADLPETIRRRAKTPLGGSPLDAWCRHEATSKRLGSLVATPTARFFAASAFPPNLWTTDAEVWTNLRALGLEYWLRWANVSQT